MGTLLEMTLYSAVVFAALLALRALLRQRLSPALRCGLWLVLLARLALPVTVESGIHIGLPALPRPAAATVQAFAPQVPSEPGANTALPSRAQPAGVSTAIVPNVPTQATAPALKLSPEQIALWVWRAGAAAGLLYVALLYVLLRRRVCRAQEPSGPSNHLVGLFEETKQELGIRAPVALKCLVGGGTPALLFPRTVLLPLDTLSGLDDGAIRCVLRHELTHYRRGDHWLMPALAVLQAVYWFNPVVWLAFPLIRADMEAACDAAVVRGMGAQWRSFYATMLLSLFSDRRSGYLAPGLGGVRRTAEQRIRSVFAPERTSRGVRLACGALAAVLLLGCFTTACQPTPTKPAVVQKGQSKLLQTPTPAPRPSSSLAVEQSAAPAQPVGTQVDAPSKYQADLELADGKLTIKADADVWTPNATALPVVRVKAADFTQTQVDGLLRALFAGKKIYEYQYGKMSKEDIDTQIVWYKKQKTDKDNQNETAQADLDESIQRLMEAGKTAPDKTETKIVPSDGQLRLIESTDRFGAHQYNYPGISVTTDSTSKAKTDVANFTVENNNDLKEALIDDKGSDGLVHGMIPLHRGARIRYNFYADMDSIVNWGTDNTVTIDMQQGIQDDAVLKVLKMTPAQAGQKAQDFLSDAGITDMAVRSVSLVTDSGQDADGKPAGKGHYAWYVQFNRVVDALPCAYLNGDSGNMDMNSLVKEGTDTDKMKFAGFWTYETMDMVLDDSGILEMNWVSPMEVTDTLNDQTVLLPFSDIQSRFEQQMKFTYEPQVKDMGFDSMDFEVTAVRLELQRISEKDSFESGLLVPVWNFYGIQKVGGNNSMKVQQGSLMTINAVDGSVIDPAKGY